MEVGRSTSLSIGKHKKSVGIALFLSILVFSKIYAQEVSTDTINSYKINDNTFIVDGNLNVSSSSIISQHRSVLNIGDMDSLGYEGYIADSISEFVTIRFKQFHRHIEVFNAVCNFTEKDNKVWSIMGNLVKGISNNLPNIPTLDAVSALNVAIESVNASQFTWENDDEETLIKEINNDTSATNFPAPGTLVYVWGNNQQDSADYSLAWRFKIKTFLPYDVRKVFINATNGDVISNTSLLDNCGQIGQCVTHYNSNQSILTNYNGGLKNYYDLKDCLTGNGGEIHTLWKTKHALTFDVRDGDNAWGTDDQNPTSCHWAVGKAREYFKNYHNRLGIGNMSKKLILRVDDGTQNASFDGTNNFSIGTRPWDNKTKGSLDVIAHEYTHGVVKYTAGFNKANDPVYKYEAGALNESFADIFGVLSDYKATGILDWTIGESVSYNPRHLYDPSLDGSPTYYKGSNWYYGTDYESFSHVNNSIPNFWFYKVFNYTNYDIAAKIVYNNLNSKLFSSAHYMDARVGSIQAAKEYWGVCSLPVSKTISAWTEVGVGTGYADPYCVTIGGTSNICYSKLLKLATITYTATSEIPADYYVWSSYATGTTGPAQYSTSGNKLFLSGKGLSIGSQIVISVVAYFPNNFTVSNYYIINVVNCDGTQTLFPISSQVDPSSIFKPKQNGGFRSGSASPLSNFASVFPNPSSNYFTITGVGNNCSVSIYDILGKKLSTQIINDNERINVFDLANGLYLVKLTMANGIVEIHKVNISN